jgi:ParB family chromosome partitioning protein
VAKNKPSLNLTGFEDIFNVTEPQNGEYIQMLPIIELHAPDCHPFQVNDDDEMTRLAESVKKYGVREPGLARPRADGGYELLCGNRRKRACTLAGIDTMPVIVRNISDDLAVIAMVDSNLQQRETILPSEKAWAYRMKMEALNHNGVKSEKLSADIVAEQAGESKAQIFRHIRLTELIEKLLDMVDTKQLALTPAVELSHLSYDEQHAVVECMSKYAIKPSLSQAVRLKKLNLSGELTPELIDSILSEVKKPSPDEPKGSEQSVPYDNN